MSTAAESKLEAIVDAAARLFMERGYEATSVRELAKAAGVSQATLYYYIHSKSDLLVLLHNSVVDDLVERLNEVTRSAEPPEEKLRRFIRTEMEAVQTSRTRVAAFIRERRSLTPEAAAKIQLKRDQVDSVLDDILEAGIRDGTFREVPIRSVRLAILGMINWAVEWMNPSGSMSGAALGDEFFNLVIFGLAPRGLPSA